jgi:glycopeptide antibiotics resistance protein
MRGYINPIATGILMSLLLIYLAFIPLLIHQYRRYGAIKLRGNIVTASFIVYMITAWFMTILPLPSFEAVEAMKAIKPNFRPFLFIHTFLSSSGFSWVRPGTWLLSLKSASFYTVAFNIVLTIPFGVYMRQYFKLSLPFVALSGFLLSFFYEATQLSGLYGIYPKAYRFADVDDLIVNTLGSVLGYFLSGCLRRFLPDPSKDKPILTGEAGLFRRILSFMVDSILIGILFEVCRAVIYSLGVPKVFDFPLYLTFEVAVFLVLPMLTKRKQTLGMCFLRLHLTDHNGQPAKTSSILLHNLLVGMWYHFIRGAGEILQGSNWIYQILQLLLLLCFDDFDIFLSL